MASVPTFLVCYRASGERIFEYIQALNAQDAVDFAREYLGAEIVIEVSKIVKNWR